MNYVEIRGIVPSWSSQDSVETFPTWFDGRIKYVRTRTAQVAVTSGIVKRFDIVGYVDHGKFAILVNVLSVSLFLQASKDRFRDCIVAATAFAAHARFKMIGLTEPAPGVAAILSSLIRMYERVPGTSASHRHQYSIEYDFAINGRTGSPTDNFAGKQIHDDG